MANKWLVHIKKTMKKMKATGKYVAGKGLKQVIMAAKKTWHKAKKGGADSDSDEEKPMKGGADDMEDVPLSPAAAPPAAKETTGTQFTDPATGDGVLGGRHRKTRRRRRHSRRR